MIEDKELRDLFKVESEERLLHLDDGLLQLERSPADPTPLEDLFREAHSLKGAARIMGLSEIEDLAHQFEDALGQVQNADAASQSDAMASMNRTLDAIRQLVKAAVGENVGAEVSVGESASPAATPQDSEPVSSVAQVAPHSDVFRIETIRVDPKRLDALLTQSGELRVTKLRIARRLGDIDELLAYCDDWNRALYSAHRSATAGEQITPRLVLLQEMLSRLRTSLDEDSARLDFVADKIDSGVHGLRLLPMSTLFMLFPRLVHDLAREQNKEVELIIEGDDTVADKRVLEEMKDPLMHILRNAIDHGIEAPEQREQAGKPRTATVRIRASQTPDSIIIEVSDDGRGLDLDEIRCAAVARGLHQETELAGMTVPQIQALILAPGFSTSDLVTEVSGRGVGLDVVRSNVERLKGRLQIDSSPGEGLTLRMHLPVSLATVRVMIAASSGQRYALPVEYVRFARKIPLREIYLMEGRQTISIDEQSVSVARLDDLLGLPVSSMLHRQSTMVCVILNVGEERFGVLVDEVVDELEVVLKPQSKLLKRVRNVSGATVLDTGEVCAVLNPHDLLKTLCKQAVGNALLAAIEAAAAPAKKVLLLAEDSITTRTQEKRILEGAGYEVVTAVDGMDAFNKLGTRPFDAVVSDIMMPNMTGLALAEKIRADGKYTDLPIILVTSLATAEDQRRGLEAGANAYITKPEFDQRQLLECLARLI